MSVSTTKWTYTHPVKQWKHNEYEVKKLPKGSWLLFRVCTKCQGTGHFPPTPKGAVTLAPVPKCPEEDCEDGLRVCRADTREDLQTFMDGVDP
jgi:hypothetical protein